MFKACDFCYTIDSGPSLGLFLNILFCSVPWIFCSFVSGQQAHIHTPAVHQWVDFGSTHSPGSVSKWLVGLNSLLVLLHLHHQHNLFSTSCIIQQVQQATRGGASNCSQPLMAALLPSTSPGPSTVLPRQVAVPNLPITALNEGQNQLSYSHDLCVSSPMPEAFLFPTPPYICSPI